MSDRQSSGTTDHAVLHGLQDLRQSIPQPKLLCASCFSYTMVVLQRYCGRSTPPPVWVSLYRDVNACANNSFRIFTGICILQIVISSPYSPECDHRGTIGRLANALHRAFSVSAKEKAQAKKFSKAARREARIEENNLGSKRKEVGMGSGYGGTSGTTPRRRAPRSSRGVFQVTQKLKRNVIGANFLAWAAHDPCRSR